MNDLNSPADKCYKSDNYPHVVAKSLLADFEFIFKTLSEEEKFFKEISELSDKEGKFANSIVFVHYSENHVEAYPYLSTFDSEDFEIICKKYPTAYKIEVFNLKNFRELYFTTIYDENDWR